MCNCFWYNQSRVKTRLAYTVVRPALWICGGKPCSFHLMSLSSKYKGQITWSRQFFTETEGKYIHTSEFYPQSLRKNNNNSVHFERNLANQGHCPKPPQHTVIFESILLISKQLDFHQKSPWTPMSQLSPVCPLCLKFENFLDQITSFDMLWKVPFVNLSKMFIRLCPGAYSSG